MQIITKIKLFHLFSLCNFSILLRFIFLFWPSLKQKLLSSEARRLMVGRDTDMSYCPIMKWTLNLMKLMLFRRVSCRKNQFSSILEKRQSVYYTSKNRENREKRKNRYCEQNSLLFSSAILKYYTKSLVVSNWWGEEEQWAKRDWDLLGPPTRVLKGSK